MSNNSIWGTSIGAGAGLYEGIINKLDKITTSSAFDAIMLAAIGAVVGFLITYIKKKIKK
jgi:hypothetical protein